MGAAVRHHRKMREIAFLLPYGFLCASAALILCHARTVAGRWHPQKWCAGYGVKDGKYGLALLRQDSCLESAPFDYDIIEWSTNEILEEIICFI